MVRPWPVWALSALSLAVLVAGIVATGGPAQGRAEKRDQTRQRDLSEIHGLLLCKAQQAGKVTTDPTPIEACPQTPRLADAFTSTPYRIELVPLDSIRLCAGFELPSDTMEHGHDQSGCIVHRIVLD